MFAEYSNFILLILGCLVFMKIASNIFNFFELLVWVNIVMFSFNNFRILEWGQLCVCFKWFAIELLSFKWSVNLRESLVVVYPIYKFSLEEQSPNGHLNWYTTLDFCRNVVFGDALLVINKFSVLCFLVVNCEFQMFIFVCCWYIYYILDIPQEGFPAG